MFILQVWTLKLKFHPGHQRAPLRRFFDDEKTSINIAALRRRFERLMSYIYIEYLKIGALDHRFIILEVMLRF